MKKLMIFSLALCLGLLGCKKDTNNNVIIDPDPTANYVTATVNGIVIDESGAAIKDAMVTLSGTNTSRITDENGYFSLTSSYVRDKGAFLKIEKSGYFFGSRTFIPHNGKARVRVMLIAATHVGTVSKSAGGSVTTNGGATVELPADAVVLKAGGSYTGTMVNVAAKWLDPSSNTTGLTMPGDLRAEDEAGTAVVLASAGMMAVELTGDGGEALQLADGKSATLSFPLSSDLEASAPATVPLWSFDEEAGTWKEEGEATKQGNKYIGAVSHFSFWNCDLPFVPITLTLTVLTSNGDPVSNAFVNLTFDDSWFSGSGYTNDEGIVSGYVPSNEVIEMTISAQYDCTPLLTQNIGPFTTDVSLTVDFNPFQTLSITGQLLDCNSEPIANGYVIVSNDPETSGTIFNTDDFGNFSVDYLICTDENLYVSGYNISDLTTSEQIIVPSTEDADLAGIFVCESLETFLSITLNGETFLSPVAYCVDSIGLNFNIRASPKNNFDFQPIVGLGTYDILNFDFEDYSSWSSTEHNLQTTVTELNDDYVGGTIQGTFDALVDSLNTMTITVEGNYRASR